MKIAMWSGPRNLSTAMMYSFGNRDDCVAVDEPFYAAYLAQSGVSHPMNSAILASQDNNPQNVADWLAGPNPDGASIWYQKHMTHHMLPDVPLDWAKTCKNVFLIRHPARVVASYDVKNAAPTLADLGFEQQLRLMRLLGGDAPLVIDSADIRLNPKRALGALCDALDIPLLESNLAWPNGPKPFDGAWADHWYGAVHGSKGFAGEEGPLPKLERALDDVASKALPIYEEMAQYKLRF